MSQKIKKAIPFRDLHFAMNDIELCCITSDDMETETYHIKSVEHTLLLIVGGKGFLKIESSLVSLQKGHCIHLPPKTKATFTLTQESGEPLQYYMLTFDMFYKVVGSINSSATDEVFPHGVIKGLHFQLIEEKMKALLSHVNEQDARLLMQQHFHFQQLIYFMLEHNNQERTENAKVAVERTIQYIQEHYQEVTHIEQLAQMANMSRRWYNSLFKDITGQNPTDYLTEVRIRRAKELLSMTNNRLFDIARAIGFQDEHYFSRRFKQTVGLSPRQYVLNRRHVGISVTYPELLYSIGITPIAAPIGHKDLPSYLKEPFANVMRLSCSNVPDYESIRIAKPDFILAPAWKDEHHYDTLSSIATTVLLPEREHWWEELRDMADVLGKGKEAERVIQRYEVNISVARDRLHKMIQGESVVYLRMIGDKAVVYGADSNRGKLIYQDLGLKAPQALQDVQSGTALSVGMLSALDADHIIFHIDHHIKGTQETYQQWTTSEEWQQLTSFKRSQLYSVGGMEWYNFSFSPLATSRAIEEIVHCLEKRIDR